MCCADQAIFVRFLFEVCWLLSFFSPEVPVQGELVRARGFRSRAFNSALARLAGCRARGGLPTRAPRPDDSRQVSGFAVAPLSWLCVYRCKSDLESIELILNYDKFYIDTIRNSLQQLKELAIII